MFGKPKKLEVGKPASAEESIAVKKELKRMYPHLTDAQGNWTKPKKKEGKKTTALDKVKGSVDAKQKSLEDALTPGELKRYAIRGKYRNTEK